MPYRTAIDLAKEKGIKVATIRYWCRTGQLRCMNVSRDPDTKKPRYLITDEDWAVFERSRQVTPVAKTAKTETTSRPRRKRNPKMEGIEEVY
jgi:hypothetical protein